MVRINAVGTGHEQKDLEAVVRPSPSSYYLHFPFCRPLAVATRSRPEFESME